MFSIAYFPLIKVTVSNVSTPACVSDEWADSVIGSVCFSKSCFVTNFSGFQTQGIYCFFLTNLRIKDSCALSAQPYHNLEILGFKIKPTKEIPHSSPEILSRTHNSRSYHHDRHLDWFGTIQTFCDMFCYCLTLIKIVSTRTQ